MYNGIGPEIHDRLWANYEKTQWPNFRNLAYRLRSLASQVLEAVKGFLDPSQFD